MRAQIARRDINHLLANNKEWIKSKKEADPKFFEKARPSFTLDFHRPLRHPRAAPH